MKNQIDIYTIIEQDGSYFELNGSDAFYDWTEDNQIPSMELVLVESKTHQYPKFNLRMVTYEYKRKDNYEI